MKKVHFSAAVAILLAILVTAPAFGASKKKAEPVQHGTIISSVTPTVITVTEGKVAKTFAITQFTEINVNGQKATVADLKPGMTVNLTLADPSRLSRIVATGAK